MMRLGKRMSQARLAAAVGISQPFLNNFETGRYVPSLKRLEAIAMALSCSAADLISDEPDEEGCEGVANGFKKAPRAEGGEELDAGGAGQAREAVAEQLLAHRKGPAVPKVSGADGVGERL